MSYHVSSPTSADLEGIIELLYISEPLLKKIFSGHRKEILIKLLRNENTLFSLDNISIVRIDEVIAGMVLYFPLRNLESYIENTFEIITNDFKDSSKVIFEIFNELNDKIYETLLENGRQYLYVQNLSVFEAWRKKGIGGKLLEHVEVYSKQTGCRGIILDVKKNNKLAIEFYLNRSYKFIREISFWYENTQAVLYRMLKII